MAMPGWRLPETMTALPTRKLEAFRYTDLRALAAISFATNMATGQAGDLPALGIPRLVFLNGRFSAAHSDTIPFTRDFTPVADDGALPLAQINAGEAQDGITLDISEGVDAGAVLLVSHAAGTGPFAFHPRHRITLGAGARLVLVEVAQGDGVYWHNPVTDIVLHEGAKLAHYRLQDESREAFHLATIRVNIAGLAAYESFTACLGAKLSRAEFHARLHGARAHAHINAAQILGTTQLGDFTTVINHAAPDCASRQTVKSVLSGAARGVFQGRIEVDRVAQKTDGYQMTQALLLSPGAEMDIKPELQIFADDVKCSHGATIGALDPEQIFYLRSRGIPEAQAREMLIRAFLDEALEPVSFAPARELFEAKIAAWWAGT
ncbi:MAG: Fe-S cluster assembly protein SufD [Acidocella sp.]|nr:Fe-S cluster assembly protein SufD [Acidocella sp.]